MKKLEKILVMLFVAGLVMRSLKMPEGGIAQVMAGCSLSFLYLTCTFFLVTGASFKVLYRRSVAGMTPGLVLKNLVAGLVFGYTILALLYKTMAWPGGDEMIETALAGLVIITAITLTGYFRNKRSWDKQLLVRQAVYMALSLAAWAVPAHQFLRR